MLPKLPKLRFASPASSPLHGRFALHNDDCFKVLQGLPSDSIDAVVTDPPYGISYFNNAWDYDLPKTAIWRECYRVLKPGGHILVFASTKTFHRMTLRVENAGFEIRDTMTEAYSHEIEFRKLIAMLDAHQLRQLERAVGNNGALTFLKGKAMPRSQDISKAIDKLHGANRRVIGKANGVGTYHANAVGNDFGFKRSYDITEATTSDAKHWEGWGTTLKPSTELVCIARKPLSEKTVAYNVLKYGVGGINIDATRIPELNNSKGRFPSNFVYENSPDVIGLFPNAAGKAQSAAGFFYCAHASKRELGAGVIHPTPKPLSLMQYLCRLVTPENGIIFDPYSGVASTGVAALREHFRFIGSELDKKYFEAGLTRLREENAKHRSNT